MGLGTGGLLGVQHYFYDFEARFVKLQSYSGAPDSTQNPVISRKSPSLPSPTSFLPSFLTVSFCFCYCPLCVVVVVVVSFA